MDDLRAPAARPERFINRSESAIRANSGQETW
jgi:hypothetical protein